MLFASGRNRRRLRLENAAVWVTTPGSLGKVVLLRHELLRRFRRTEQRFLRLEIMLQKTGNSGFNLQDGRSFVIPKRCLSNGFSSSFSSGHHSWAAFQIGLLQLQGSRPWRGELGA